MNGRPRASSSYDAVVLAGGDARRLGGADKPAVVVGGRTLLDRVLGAVEQAGRTIVVGPVRPVCRPVVWAREQPPGGGPVAALAAGLVHVEASLVAVLAADLPFLDAATVQRLVALVAGGGAPGGGAPGGTAPAGTAPAGTAPAGTAPAVDGALLVDGDGRDQLLAGVWRTCALRDAVAGQRVYGARLGGVLGGLHTLRVAAPASGGPAPWFDCDTPHDVDAARALATTRAHP